MSSQKRIDQYFQSTSSNKATVGTGKQEAVKTLNRLSTGRRLPNYTNRGNSRSLKSTSFITYTSEKITQQSREVPTEISSDDLLFGNLSIVQDCSLHEKSVSSDSSIPDSHVTTPKKKTIKGFAMACNSPPVHRSPAKISLKRSNGNSPAIPSPLKKPAVYRQTIVDDDETNMTRTTDESIFKCEGGQSIVPAKHRKIDNSHEQVEKDDNTVEKRANDANIQTNNFVNDDLCHSGQTKTDLAKRKRKMDDLSSSMNSQTSNGWKLSVSIETSTRGMTALSTNWQKTLDESNNATKILGQTGLKLNVGSVNENHVNYLGNESTTCKMGDENCYNAGAKKSSPRRALFSSEIPTKTTDRTDGVASGSLMRTENDVPSPKNASKKSSKAIFDTTEKINENSNLVMKSTVNENLPTTIIEPPLTPTKVNETAIIPTKITEPSITPTKVDRIENSPMRITEASICPKKKIEPSIILSKIVVSARTPTKVCGTAENSPTKKSRLAGWPEKLMNPCESPVKENGFPKSPEKGSDLLKTPTKKIQLLATPTKSPSGGSQRSSFSPRVKSSPQKPYKDRLDTQLMDKAVENLNQAKQGIISENNFDLELIYTTNNFEFEYGNLKPDTAIKYETRDVRPPREKHADYFFMVLVNVFSEPMNCGYFDENEIDTVFSILTLSPAAQSLLARMLKRKRGWHRVPSIKYPEIADNLEPIFKELVHHQFLDDDIENEDLSRSLNLLQADEIRAVCQAMKISYKGTKPKQINDLVKLSNKKKSLFPGMKTPSSALTEKVKSMLGLCIRLPERVENLLDRIFILLIPTQDPKENMADAFRMLIQVHFGDKVFPTTPKERFPIFTDRSHLIRYAKARSAWHRIINAIEAKDWENVRALGQLAYDHLNPHFKNNGRGEARNASSIPSHVKRFDANYVWVKVMSKSVEGFKKTKESMATAAEFLHALISPKNDIPSNRTRWYSELALIESYHRKNYETSADITIEALMQNKISEIDVAELLERARILAKSKAVRADTKDRINVAVRLRQEMFISSFQPTIKEIVANMVSGNTTGSKSTWSVNIGGSDTGYLRVEDVARRHYLGDGFRDGIHCEGALPVTLFATLLWDEIYTIPVPGAFLSSYQTAPLDLYTSRFLENRRERIEEKLKTIRRLDLDHLSNIMQEDFAKYRNYESLMHGNLFEEPEHFKDFIECLGIDAVVGIAERLAENYNQWKSGFPDLALWNPVTKKCKIVEVKGPGDSLSTKQKLWIQFLECLGVGVEVCVVKGTTRKYST